MFNIGREEGLYLIGRDTTPSQCGSHIFGFTTKEGQVNHALRLRQGARSD